MKSLFERAISATICSISLICAVEVAHSTPLSCEDVFRTAPNLENLTGHRDRRKLATLIADAGLSSSAYAVQWKLKETSNPGPYPTSGEFLAIAVPFEKLNDWVSGVGKNTIGLAVEGHPEDGRFHSAILRIGTHLYEWSDIQENGSFKELTQNRPYEGFTEATFIVTKAEMRAIEKFIADRSGDGIKAVKKVRNGPDVGEVINPEFDYSKNTLTKESCAGACSSFYNPLWLTHYKAAEGGEAVNSRQKARFDAAMILENMRVRLGLESTPIAKAMVWRHARNPNLMAITQVGTSPAATSNFIERNKWGVLKGMPVYSLIPDPKGGENNQVIAKRTALAEWLAQD